MYRPYHYTRLAAWRNRRELNVGAATRIERGAIFSTPPESRIDIGSDCRIRHGAILATYGGWIEIADKVNINPYTILYGHGGLTIGRNVSIAAHCVIVSAEHVFENTDITIRAQGVSRTGIVIEDDVWIGANCVVTDGALIGRGSVIGAGAVVRGEIAGGAVYGGVPARKLRDR